MCSRPSGPCAPPARDPECALPRPLGPHGLRRSQGFPLSTVALVCVVEALLPPATRGRRTPWGVSAAPAQMTPPSSCRPRWPRRGSHGLVRTHIGPCAEAVKFVAVSLVRSPAGEISRLRSVCGGPCLGLLGVARHPDRRLGPLPRRPCRLGYRPRRPLGGGPSCQDRFPRDADRAGRRLSCRPLLATPVLPVLAYTEYFPVATPSLLGWDAVGRSASSACRTLRSPSRLPVRSAP